MRDNLIDFEIMRNKKIEEKHRKEKEKEREEKRMKNTELFKEVVEKKMIDLTFDEMMIYNEVGVVCSFIVEGMYSMCIATFRDQMYVINNIGGKFEYIGKLEDIISKGVFGGK